MEDKRIIVREGTWYIWHKNAWKSYDKYRIKHRKKKFVRIVTRIVAGPTAGGILAILTYQLLQLPLLACAGLALGIAWMGLYLRFCHVKYVYLGLVISLYLFLILRMLLR